MQSNEDIGINRNPVKISSYVTSKTHVVLYLVNIYLLLECTLLKGAALYFNTSLGIHVTSSIEILSKAITNDQTGISK